MSHTPQMEILKSGPKHLPDTPNMVANTHVGEETCHGGYCSELSQTEHTKPDQCPLRDLQVMWNDIQVFVAMRIQGHQLEKKDFPTLTQSKVSCGCHGERSSQKEGNDLCGDENRKKRFSEHQHHC